VLSVGKNTVPTQLFKAEAILTDEFDRRIVYLAYNEVIAG